mgnify:CR=1 FL=1
MPTAFGSRFAAQRAELLKRVANIGIFQILNDDERHELLVHGVMHNFNDDEIIFEDKNCSKCNALLLGEGLYPENYAFC